MRAVPPMPITESVREFLARVRRSGLLVPGTYTLTEFLRNDRQQTTEYIRDVTIELVEAYFPPTEHTTRLISALRNLEVPE